MPVASLSFSVAVVASCLPIDPMASSRKLMSVSFSWKFECAVIGCGGREGQAPCQTESRGTRVSDELRRQLRQSGWTSPTTSDNLVSPATGRSAPWRAPCLEDPQHERRAVMAINSYVWE